MLFFERQPERRGTCDRGGTPLTMEFAEAVSALSRRAERRQSPLLQLSHDRLGSHLIDLLLLLAHHAFFVELGLSYDRAGSRRKGQDHDAF